jgi:hypothetical protein
LMQERKELVRKARSASRRNQNLQSLLRVMRWKLGMPDGEGVPTAFSDEGDGHYMESEQEAPSLQRFPTNDGSAGGMAGESASGPSMGIAMPYGSIDQRTGGEPLANGGPIAMGGGGDVPWFGQGGNEAVGGDDLLLDFM